MAFKMKRPLKMNGPKKSGLKLGRVRNSNTKNQIGEELSGDTDSTFYYNSKMGPMKMVTPSALRQIEEEKETIPTEEVPTEGGGEEKAEHIAGQEIEVVGDGKYQIDTEDLGYGIAGLPEGQTIIEVLDPNGVLGNLTTDDYVRDDDFTWEVKEGKVYIIGERVLEEGE
mgnify:CR=1 FL=1